MAESTLKIWVMSSEYYPNITGGLGVVATHLAQELQNLGAKITIISRARGSVVKVVRGQKLTVLQFPLRYDKSRIVNFLAKRDFKTPDVIHIHSLLYVDLLRYYKKKFAVPTVYTCHSLVLKKTRSEVFTPRRQAQLLRRVDHVVVPSQAEYAKLTSNYPFCRTKASVIEHGIAVTDQVEAKPSTHHLLYAGRITRGKGVGELIDAIALLRARNPVVELSIIGQGRRSYLSELRRRARRMGVPDKVHWLGKYDYKRLQAAYAHFGAVVMPSRAESFGLVALEALAHGVPLVATKAGGLSQFVSAEVAQVIPRVEGHAIAAAIESMWSSPSATKERVEAGKRLALKYEWTMAAGKYAELFLRLREDKREKVNPHVQ